MEWQIIVALVVAIPIILFPAAYVWCINIGGIYAAIKQAREKQAARRMGAKFSEEISPEQEYENALADAVKRYPWH